MTERVTYIPTPQHRLEGQWRECPPAEARRWAVVRKRWLPKKRGMARPAPKCKTLAVFYGPDAQACARQLAAHSIALTRPRPSKTKPPLYQSLTKMQWLEAQQNKEQPQ